MVSWRVYYGCHLPGDITSRAGGVGASLFSLRQRLPACAYESRAVAEIYILKEEFNFFRVGQCPLGPGAVPVLHPCGRHREDDDPAGLDRHVVRPHGLAYGY